MTLKRLQLTSNIDPAKAASGDVGVLIPVSQVGGFKNYSVAAADLWKIGNVAYDAAHKDYSFVGSYGSNVNFLSNYLDVSTSNYIKQFTFDFAANPTGYAGMYFGAAASSSAGTTALNFDFYSARAGVVVFSAKDTALVVHSCSKNVVAGWQAISIPWIGAAGTGFSQTTFTHPATQFSAEPASTMPVGAFMFNAVRYDAVITMAGSSPTVLNGMQFALAALDAGDYNIWFGSIKLNQVVVDGPVADPARYKGIPRWTYKWMGAENNTGYGAWRGPSAVGYNWLMGWTESGIVNPDNGAVLSDAMLQMMYDSQQAYKTQFPAKLIGPFVPRYGRPSWEALNTGGYVAGVWTSNTYNKWYWPGTDDWYGYTVRALLSVAGHYYLTRSAQAKTILDNWMAWLDANIIADGAYWWPPSGYGNDGNPTYTYHPVYSYTCIAAACIYKYWVDGDALALKWYRRMLDDIYARKRMTATGNCIGISRTTEGSGYTTATVNFTVNGGATAPTATAVIAGGKIVRYVVNTQGLGITSISATVSGDGAGATCNPYLNNLLVGAFDANHSGWELAELFNTYAMLVNGGRPGGTVTYPITLPGGWDVSTGSYTTKSLSSATQDATTNGIAFSADGTKMYVVGDTNNTIYQYTLTTAWDVSTGSYANKSKSVAAEDALPWGLTFSPDGTIMYVSGETNKKVYQYTLSTAWDVSTATYATKSLLISGQDTKPRGIVFNAAGTTLMVAGYSNDTIFQYTLTTAWDLSTGSYATKSKWIGAQSWVTGLAFNPAGTLMYTAGVNVSKLFQYTLTTAWDLSTASYATKFLLVSGQDATPQGLVVKPDGLQVYVAGQVNDATYQYALTSAGGDDLTAFLGLYALYQRNSVATRPSLQTADWIPLHEWDIDPYHNGSGIENPMVKDTHARGAMWTETLAPTLYAAVEYGRYSGSWTWLNTLYALVLEFIGMPGGSTQLAGTPRVSTGLSDAYTDMIGGEPLQANKRGNLDSATYVVNASKQIIIPAAAGGGNVTWVRGAWATGVIFRYEGFMADISPDYAGDTTNYATVSAQNVYSGGVYSTVIQLAASATIGATLQVYYSYRDGLTSIKGEAIAGWPMLHRDPYQGTANDGDNYLMMALYHAWRSTADVKYKNAAQRIGYALLDAGRRDGNEVTFSLPFEEEAGQVGLYSYHGSNTPLSLDTVKNPSLPNNNALNVKSTVLTGQTPANYAGFGFWPSWSIDANTPFTSIDFDLCWYINLRLAAQAAHERFSALALEIDADACTLTFGVAPCTATGTQCYNTYGTCKDKPHYTKGVKTYKFCLRGMAIPPGQTLRPYISAHAFSPTEIPVGGGLAVRSRTSLTLADEVCADREGDPYAATRATPAEGTFWTRFLARNYNIQGRLARIRKGYITEPFDWETFQTELYMIESIKGPDGSGNVQVVLSDVIKTLDKNLLPAPTSGKLTADFKAVENTGYAAGGGATTIILPQAASALDGAYTGMECYITQNTAAGQRRTITGYVGATRTATVAPWAVNPDTTSVYEVSALGINVGTGKGAQYADPAVSGVAEYIAIGNEVILYTAKAGDVLSWSSSAYRAQFGTAREDHSADAGVQRCFTVIDLSASDTIHKLANAAGIADAHLDLAGLAAEDISWLRSVARITACIAAPEKASAMLNELLRDLNMAGWWDAVAQQFKFKADMPQPVTTLKTITPDETIGVSMQVDPLDELRITQAFISYAPYSATGNMAARQNFKITDGYEDVGAEGANEYSNIVQVQNFSRWLSSANQLHARSLVARRVSRLRDAPFKAKFKVDPRDEVHMADLIDVTTRKKTDASGVPVVTRMRVTKLLDGGNFDVEAFSTVFGRRYAFIAPNGYPDYASASTAQRSYGYIAANTGLMSDGSGAYLIL